jgi:asparagine synthase (glutamine-hydrolysing)
VSGICGLFNTDGAPVTSVDVGAMTSLLERRGPDRTGTFRDGSVGLGHTLLATTPEAADEDLPLQHQASGCVITADARLDNRDELLSLLDVPGGSGAGDAEIILRAYLKWGESCLDHLLGDFAFAIWDPRHRRLFCARDQMGMRPFYYHRGVDLFAFASEPRAILVLPQIPYRINEKRVADAIVWQLESVDQQSSFFEGVFRLPPAHTFTVTPEGTVLRRYWRLEATDELHLGSDEDYAEAFREVLTTAVASRLRGPQTTGAMLSGGVDSGSVVAIASLLRGSSEPLPTFSAVGPDPDRCIETRTIRRSMSWGTLKPHAISYTELRQVPELTELVWEVDEPFDAHMDLIRAVYFLAARAGMNAVLDGVAADTVLSEQDHLLRLLRSGRWITAIRESVQQNRVWNGAYPASRELLRNSLLLLTPQRIQRLRRQRLTRGSCEDLIRRSGLRPEFAEEVGVCNRLSQQRDAASARSRTFLEERARTIVHPQLTVGRERYDRVAARHGIEPRDPFLDLRLVQLAARLPGEQLLANGWRKSILRRSVHGLLPEEVRFRRGVEHLGRCFTAAVRSDSVSATHQLRANELPITPYVDVEHLLSSASRAGTDEVYTAACLAVWLSKHQTRPKS